MLYLRMTSYIALHCCKYTLCITQNFSLACVHSILLNPPLSLSSIWLSASCLTSAPIFIKVSLKFTADMSLTKHRESCFPDYIVPRTNSSPWNTQMPRCVRVWTVSRYCVHLGSHGMILNNAIRYNAVWHWYPSVEGDTDIHHKFLCDILSVSVFLYIYIYVLTGCIWTRST